MSPTRYVAAMITLFALAAMSFAGAGHEGSWLEERQGTVPNSRKLQVKIEGGSIRVTGGPQQEISYVVRSRIDGESAQARGHEAQFHEVSLQSHGAMASLIVRPGPKAPPRLVSEVVISVPRDLQALSLQTSGGDVSVTGIAGQLSLNTGGGRVEIDDIGGSVTAETGGDDIEVGSVAGDTTFRTGGGKISVRSAGGNLRATSGGGNIQVGSGLHNAVLESAAGDVEMKLCGGELHVSTGGGNIVLGSVGGPAEITTSGGNIRLHSATGFVRARTTAGGIELDGIPAAMAETEVGRITARFSGATGKFRNSELQTSVGDIVVYLPADLAVTIRASVDMPRGHGIRSDFPELTITGRGDGWEEQSQAAEGKLNGGGPVLHLRTGNGNIVIHRAAQ
jgi:Putative adhesin